MDANSIEILLKQAANSNRLEDNDRLFLALCGHEVFFRLNLRTVEEPAKGQRKNEPSGTPLFRLPSGQHAVVFHTSKDNPNLPRPFGGIPWERGLEMTQKMAQADGLLLLGRNQDSIAVSKENIPRILEIIGRQCDSPSSAISQGNGRAEGGSLT